MRFLFGAIALLFAFPLLGENTSFPPPIGGPRAVSESSFGPAVGDQNQPHIASNGEVAIAMWRDLKKHGWGTRISLLDADGQAIDPVGMLIDDRGDPEGIYWNGTEFVALTTDATKRTRVRLTAEGHLIDSVVLGMPVGFRLAAISGDGGRLLFVEQGGMRAAIADRHGEMSGEPVALAPPPEGGAEASVHGWVGAERNGEFVVVRVVWHETIGNLNVYALADRIDASGHMVSSTRMNVSLEYSDYVYALRGGGDAYLFVAVHRSRATVVAYRLDASGAVTGSPITLAAYDANRTSIGFRPVIVRDGAGFLVVWQPAFNWGETEVRIASLSDAASTAPESQKVASWPAYAGGIAFARIGGEAIALASVGLYAAITGLDLYSVRIAPQPSGDAERLVALTRSSQKRVEVAAGANGFGIVWVEDGPDRATHLNFRRFSRGGMPQGEPIEIDRFTGGTGSIPPIEPAIVSNGPVYLLLWNSLNGTRGRRIDAAGAWIDAEAFVLPSTEFVPAGVTAGPHEAVVGTESGIVRVRFSGEPVAGYTKGPGVHAYDTAIARSSDGYLVAWSEGDRNCQYGYCDPFDILAARYSGDGTLLDATPIVLEEGVGYPDFPAVAWAGDRYLVVWSSGGSVRGATVSTEGVLLGANPASTPGIVLLEGDDDWDRIPSVVADGDAFALVATANPRHQFDPRSSSLAGVRFRFDTPLGMVVELAPETIAERVHGVAPALAAGTDGRLLVGWIADAEPDRAPRAFFQIFGQEERRRPVRR